MKDFLKEYEDGESNNKGVVDTDPKVNTSQFRPIDRPVKFPEEIQYFPGVVDTEPEVNTDPKVNTSQFRPIDRPVKFPEEIQYFPGVMDGCKP